MCSCASVNKLLRPTEAELSATAKAASTASTFAPSSGTPSVTQSEFFSDFSDIREIALKLCVQNEDDLHSECFKVDKGKLGQMIETDSSIAGKNGAEYFFDNIMKTTMTYVRWPYEYKIDSKSKKDPYVCIVGKFEYVQVAKKKILESLYFQFPRVHMKMYVSYSDHSYIIGRRGKNIKRIMEDTQTYIHFPDSNRSNVTVKSNQVSLCGSVEGVERARAMLRLAAPLFISFEVPIVVPGKVQANDLTIYIEMVEAKYEVHVTVVFPSAPKVQSALVLVKGSEKNAEQVQGATQLLINFTCGKIANQIHVHAEMEITPQYHEIVKGKHNSNLLSIMQRTKTNITFPDLSRMNMEPLNNFRVTITGCIANVYKARQQLIGNLPLVFIFDYLDNPNNASQIMSLNTKYGVYITLTQKQCQSTLAVAIKGVEKFIDKTYDARQEILRLNYGSIQSDVPETYFMPSDKDFNLVYRIQLTSLLAGCPDNPKTPKVLANSPANLLPYMNYNSNKNKEYNKKPTAISSPTQLYLRVRIQSYERQQQKLQKINHNNNNFLQVPSMIMPHKQYQQPQPQTQQQLKTSGCSSVNCHATHCTTNSPRNTYSDNTSGYQSFGNTAGNNNMPNPIPRVNYSPDLTYNSEAGDCPLLGRLSNDGELLGFGASGAMRPLLPGSDRDMKSALGFNVMEKAANPNMLRTPNANWMGMGISRTLPVPMESATSLGPGSGGSADDWPSRPLSSMPPSQPGITASPYRLGETTGLMDAIHNNNHLQMSDSLLTSLGPEHYLTFLLLNDLEMFTTLTEEILKELGITDFNARMEILIAVRTLLASDAAGASMPITSSSQRF